jgi:hypothetical protein
MSSTTEIHSDESLIAMHLEQAESLIPRTDWETDFLSNVTERLKSGKGLTGKQADILSKMWRDRR